MFPRPGFERLAKVPAPNLQFQLIEFEGYFARVERARDGILYGRVIGLEEVIHFKGAFGRRVDAPVLSERASCARCPPIALAGSCAQAIMRPRLESQVAHPYRHGAIP